MVDQHGDRRAIDGCGNLGAVEIELRRGDAEIGGFDLRIERFEVGRAAVDVGLGGVEIGLRQQLAAIERLRPRQGIVVFGEVGLFGGLLRGDVIECRLRRLERVLLVEGVDLGDDITGFDRIAQREIDRFHHTRRLGADADEVAGLERAGCEDRGLDASLGDGDRGDHGGRLMLRHPGVGADATRAEDDKHGDDVLPGGTAALAAGGGAERGLASCLRRSSFEGKDERHLEHLGCEMSHHQIGDLPAGLKLPIGWICNSA